MPLDVRGRTSATMKAATCVRAPPERVWEPAEPPSCQGSGLVIFARERGIPSKRESPARVDQVPALCTHRPSLLPIGRLSEALRTAARHGAGQAVTGWREEGQMRTFFIYSKSSGDLFY